MLPGAGKKASLWGDNTDKGYAFRWPQPGTRWANRLRRVPLAGMPARPPRRPETDALASRGSNCGGRAARRIRTRGRPVAAIGRPRTRFGRHGIGKDDAPMAQLRSVRLSHIDDRLYEHHQRSKLRQPCCDGARGGFLGRNAYQPHIDGLRAIAVLSVVFYHLGLPQAYAQPRQRPRGAPRGRAGARLPGPRDRRAAGNRRDRAADGTVAVAAAVGGREPALLSLVRSALAEGPQRLSHLRAADGPAVSNRRWLAAAGALLAALALAACGGTKVSETSPKNTPEITPPNDTSAEKAAGPRRAPRPPRKPRRPRNPPANRPRARNPKPPAARKPPVNPPGRAANRAEPRPAAAKKPAAKPGAPKKGAPRAPPGGASAP